MNKNFIFIILLFLMILPNVNSQISLNGTIAPDENYHTENGVDYNLGYLPQYGYVLYMYEYDTMSESNKKIKIYNLNCILIKEIDCTPLDSWNLNPNVYRDGKEDITISQYLFNKDDKIEFILEDYNGSGGLIVYNEDLEIIFTFPSGYWENNHFKLICIEEETPTYKLQYYTDDYCYIYDIEGNPFSNTSTSSEMIMTNIDVLKNISVSPNPSNGLFTININKSINGTLSIYNLNGEKIIQKNITYANPKIEIDFQNQINGTYICKIVTNDGKYTKAIKLIKE